MSTPEGTICRGVALYDPETGRIAHIQRVMIFPGAPDLTPDQVVERAQVHARHSGRDTSGLAVVHLAADHDYSAPHRVDVATGSVAKRPHIPPGRGRATG